MGANVSSHEIYSSYNYGPPRPSYARRSSISVISPPINMSAPPKNIAPPPPKNTLPPPPKNISPPAKKGQVISFQSSAKWRNYFEATKQTSKLVVVDFTASWCKPCKIIQPAFNEFAERYTDVEFVKIDVDQLVDVAAAFGVHVMPTFILLKRGKEVDKVVGVKKEELQKKIEKYRF